MDGGILMPTIESIKKDIHSLGYAQKEEIPLVQFNRKSLKHQGIQILQGESLSTLFS